MKLSEIAKNSRFGTEAMRNNSRSMVFYEYPQKYLLDRSRIADLPLQDLDTEEKKRKKRIKLICHICSFVITDEAMRIAVLGQTNHCRTNPGGYTYHFKCFSDAPGCAAIGTATSEHTWFSGYAWQIACCRQCGEHLGWLFRGSDRFYGLIDGRIVVGDSSE